MENISSYYHRIKVVKNTQLGFFLFLFLQSMIVVYKLIETGATDLLLQAAFFIIALNIICYHWLKEREIRIRVELELFKFIHEASSFTVERKKQSC